MLDIPPLQQLTDLRKSLKIPIWVVMINSIWKPMMQKLELPGEIDFEKNVPYIMDLTFSKYDFEKKGGQITG